jgi:hypothetical protein
MSMTEVNSLLPRIILNKPLNLSVLISWLQGRSNLNKGEVLAVLSHLEDGLAVFLKDGYPIKLPGLGSFTPTLRLDGTINIKYRPDKELLGRLNTPDAFNGTIKNKKNIGKSIDELKQILKDSNG